MAERIVDVGGVGLAVAERGAGGEPLMLLHGFTGAKEDFADWMDAFAAEGFWVVAPDLRGHGESSKPEGEDQYSLDHFLEDTLGLADCLGWDRFAALGHSMGGMFLQLVASSAPHRLTAMVLMDTHHGSVPGIDAEIVQMAVTIAREQGMEVLADVMASMEGGPLDTPANQRLLATRPERREVSRRNTSVASADMFVAMSRRLLDQEDRLPLLYGLDIPTLVVVGEQDRPFIAASRRMVEALGRAELAVIPDAGHSPQLEAPQEWWSAVSSFLGARVR